MKTAYYELPYPPSVNHIYVGTGRARKISPRVQTFRDQVWAATRSPKARVRFEPDRRIAMRVEAYPPNRSRFDVDNALKSLMDALQKAGVFPDDNAVFRIEIERKEPRPPGMVKVWLEEVV